MKYVEFDGQREFDLILLGRVTIDFNPVDYYKTLNQCEVFKKYLGGSPANIAVGMARLGKKVGFIGKVSDDQFGTFVMDYFKKEGIDTSQITRCKNGEKLGLTFTEILESQKSSILMYRNKTADLQLNVEDIQEDYIKNAKAILISGTALAESPSREAALKALAIANKNNTKVIFDIDYRAYNWKNNDEIAIYYAIVAGQSNIILGSREEFDLTEALVSGLGTDEKSAAYWCGKGADIVVIKHGKQGSTAYTRDGKSYSIKPFPVDALKGFGGGDGYASSFLYGILDGMDVIDCLERGSAQAAMMVASHSCSEDMPSADQVRRFIEEAKEKYGEMVARY